MSKNFLKGKAMKDRPINLYPHEVRGILDGRITMLRREVKPQPVFVADPFIPFKTPDASPKGIIKCPFGFVGSRIFGREAVRVTGRSANGFRCNYATSPTSEGDGMGKFYRWEEFPHRVPKEGNTFGFFMPQILSRIHLPLTAIKVERLNEISEEDAIAEGVELRGMTRYKGEAIHEYKHLWESTRGKGTFDNRWVWVLQFLPMEKK